jgi:magnesium-transporting ATPase (P-type)
MRPVRVQRQTPLQVEWEKFSTALFWVVITFLVVTIGFMVKMILSELIVDIVIAHYTLLIAFLATLFYNFPWKYQSNSLSLKK